MKTYPKVSLLMLNWNGINFTQKCLLSLLKTTYKQFEIILVDNGSENQEAEKLQKVFGKYKNIRIIKNPKNVGYAQGMNIAYEYATGTYIMLLNNDMEFSRSWLEPLVTRMERDKNIAGCQPKIKDIKNKKKFEYSVAAGGFIDSFGYTFARGRIFSYVEDDHGQYDNAITISWAGISLIRKCVIDKIGFFDPIYFNYTEDVDLCMRMYGAGYSLAFVPSSTVYHFGGGVLGKNLPKKMFFIHRNHIILIIKNFPLKKLLLIIAPRIFMDVLSFFYYFSYGYWRISLSIVKAYASLIVLMPKVITSRKKVQKIIHSNNLKNMPHLQGSIVWEYFIRRKRFFRQISIRS